MATSILSPKWGTQKEVWDEPTGISQLRKLRFHKDHARSTGKTAVGPVALAPFEEGSVGCKVVRWACAQIALLI